jgi:peptide/nickel transport system permease protein
MLVGIEKEKRLEGISQSYGEIVRRQFRKNRPAVWSLRLLYILVFIAIFSDFIANERPIYCRVEGKAYFPVLKQYAVNLGLSSWDARFVNRSWHEQEYESVIFPPIPYSPNTLDKRNMDYIGPFDAQRVPSRRFRHWLGTDQIGRDIAAGLIAGTRTAMLVGLISMAIATLIGVFLGALAGYFGDTGLRISRIRLWLNVLALPVGFFLGFVARSYALSEGSFGSEFFKSTGIVLATLLLVNLPVGFLKKIPAFGRQVTLPLDLLIMRLIEIMNSIPTLLLILSVVAVIEKASILYVMAIIGLIRWTGIARFIRAELLRIRKLEYIEAAQALGFSKWQIIRRHALPNALTPVFITVSFGIAGAILLEASLSFLGIGVPPDQVTWGSLLREARVYFGAWWLAIFPGLAIFVTVTIFNLLGEGLTDALDPKLRD